MPGFLFVVLMCVVVVVTCYYTCMSNENGFQSFYTLIYLDENCFESIHYNYGNQWRSQSAADARAQHGHTMFASSLVPRPRPASPLAVLKCRSN